MEGAQDAQAVLAAKPPQLRLRLLRWRKPRERWLPGLLCLMWGGLYVWLTESKSTGIVWSVLFLLALGISLPYGAYRMWEWWRDGPDKIPVGYLDFAPAYLFLCLDGTETTHALDATLRLKLEYQGHKGESLGTRHPAPGDLNFIQIEGCERFAFEVPDEHREQLLRQELRRWYHLGVRLKEYRQQSPTFLLHRNLSYEQIQAYKREFGVNLYG